MLYEVITDLSYDQPIHKKTAWRHLSARLHKIKNGTLNFRSLFSFASSPCIGGYPPEGHWQSDWNNAPFLPATHREPPSHRRITSYNVCYTKLLRLLRVLQERTYTPVGSHENIPFRGRIIAATNRSLDELRRAGIV